MKQSVYNKIILIVAYFIYKKIQNREKINNELINKTVAKATDNSGAKTINTSEFSTSRLFGYHFGYLHKNFDNITNVDCIPWYSVISVYYSRL